MAILNGNEILFSPIVNFGEGGGAITSDGQPIPVNSAEEMDSIITNATETDIGKIYIFLGASTETYEQDALYIITDGEGGSVSYDIGIIINSTTSGGAIADIDVYGKTIPLNFFLNKTGLTKVKILDGSEVIGESAFEDCTGLTSIEFPDTLISISKKSFYYCTKLTAINIPNNVQYIGESAFNNCTALTEVYWNAQNIKAVGNTSLPIFEYCKKISTLVFGDDVKSIPSYIFRECTSPFGNVVLPEGVEYVGQDAFYGATGLTSINIPSSVTSFGTYTFYKCTGLTTVYWNAPNIASVGSTQYPIFDSCSALTNFIIGENVVTLPQYMLRECTGIVDITIPKNVDTVGDQAFYSCTKLANVTFKGTPTTIASNAFGSCSALTTINVPWAEGAVANAPWGATNATINYNYTEG